MLICYYYKRMRLMKRKNFILIILFGAFLSLNFTALSYAKTDSNPQTDDKKAVLEEKVRTNPIRQQILSMLETGLNSNTSQEGQVFSAKLMEDVFYDEQALIPKFSIVYGSIVEIKKAGQLSKNAFIKLKITEIKTPEEKIISISNKPMIIDIYQPVYKSKKENFIKELPGTIVSSATSIALGRFSSFADAAVWGISTGAKMTVGVVSGVVSPEDGKTRGETFAERALNSSPLGSVNMVVKKGEDIVLDSGQCISILFDRETVEHIKENISSTQNN